MEATDKWRNHELSTTSEEHDSLRYASCWALATYTDVIMRAGRYLTESGVSKLQQAAHTFLRCMFALRTMALANGDVALWKPSPKMHIKHT